MISELPTTPVTAANAFIFMSASINRELVGIQEDLARLIAEWEAEAAKLWL
jgi:hypothetical protein